VIYQAKLKKPWRSPRGKLYPEGSTFKFVRRLPDIDSAIYDFKSPGYGYGWIVLSNKIFKPLTKEEKIIKESRRKMIEEHMKKTANPFTIS